MSSEVKWTDKGATISSLNAVKEFPILTNEDVDAAIADGRLDTRAGTFMGKTYTKLLRHQVKKLARRAEKSQKDGSSDEEEEDEEEEEEEETRREPKWTDKGATISDKNAVKEFPALTMESIESALESGDLESRDGNFMGKTYRKLLRHQVEKLAGKLAETGGGGEGGGGREEERKASKSNGGEGRKRLAEIEDQLKKIEEKKRKLLDEKKSLEDDDE